MNLNITCLEGITVYKNKEDYNVAVHALQGNQSFQ